MRAEKRFWNGLKDLQIRFASRRISLKLFFTMDATQEQMQQHCDEKLKEIKNIREKFKEIEFFLKEQLPQKTYWLKTLRVGLAHLELDIALLQEQYGEIYAS